MNRNLDKLSEILDEHIEKGMKITRRPTSKVEAYEQEISKSLSFNPFDPIAMTPDTQYYNPYMQHPSGGFMPYPDSYWAEQSETVKYGNQTFTRPRSSAGYETVREFYSIVSDRDDDRPHAIHPLFQGPLQVRLESQSRFAQFRKSVDDYIIKGSPVPVGHIHTAPDGKKYKKVAEGKWAPVASKEHRDFAGMMNDKTNPKAQAEAHQTLESSASKRKAIEDAIKEKMRSQKVIDEAKNQAVRAAADHTHKMVSSLYDGGKVPKEVDAAHKEHMKLHGADEGTRGGTRKLLHQISHNVKPMHHAVEVGFKYNGQEYTHRFPQVEAQSHSEAIARVQDILKEKLPGHTLSRIHAESPKEPGAEKQSAKPSAKTAEKPAAKPSPKGEASV